MVQSDWLGLKVGGHLALFLHSSREPGELSYWSKYYDYSTINIVQVSLLLLLLLLLDYYLGEADEHLTEKNLIIYRRFFFSD